MFLHHGLRAEGKAISSDLRPSPATGGNRFPPLDHRGRVILNLRLLLWHGGMSPLRLPNTHTHTHTRTHTHRLYTQRGRFLMPTKKGNTFLSRGGKRAPATQLLHPLWRLKVMGWPLVISVKASGYLDLSVLWFIDSLMTETHTLSHSLITVSISLLWPCSL